MSTPGGKPSGPVPDSGGKPPVLPYVLLGLMTLLSFAGPFLIALVFGGGAHPGWPPDRPVEWLAFGVITAAVVALMAVCLTVGLWSRPGKPRPPAQ
jgi:hypothetical protein